MKTTDENLTNNHNYRKIAIAKNHLRNSIKTLLKY